MPHLELWLICILWVCEGKACGVACPPLTRQDPSLDQGVSLVLLGPRHRAPHTGVGQTFLPGVTPRSPVAHGASPAQVAQPELHGPVLGAQWLSASLQCQPWGTPSALGVMLGVWLLQDP